METGQYSAGVTLLHERAQKLLTRPFVDNQSLGFPPLYFRHVIIRSNQFFSPDLSLGLAIANPALKLAENLYIQGELVQILMNRQEINLRYMFLAKISYFRISKAILERVQNKNIGIKHSAS